MKLYISGPMTLYRETDWNYGAFNAAASRLRAKGYRVLNPAENDGGSTHRPRQDYIRMDLENILEAEAVVVLPGWERSRGARLEVELALQLDMPILDAQSLLPVSANSFAQARRYAGDGDGGYLVPAEVSAHA